MHWGDYQPARTGAEAGVARAGEARAGDLGSPGRNTLRWVRPLHSILATFGPDTEEPDVVPFSVHGIVAGQVTRGHRFMAPAPIPVRRFDDYAPALQAAKVVLDAERRRGHHPPRRAHAGAGWRLRPRRGRRAVARGRRTGRMARRAPGRVRGGLPADPAGGDPRHHPRQPEVLRAAPRRHAGPRAALRAGGQHRGDRRRRGDRGGQRQGGARAAVRRSVLLRERPEGPARRPPAQARHDRLPRQARYAGRAGAPPAGPRPRPGAPGRGGPRPGRARGATRQGRPRQARWWASSPSCRA